VVTDFGVTVHLTDHVRFVESFRFNNWHKPASIVESLLYFYNAATVTGGNATLAPAAPPTLLLHNASSNPDATTRNTFRFLKSDIKSNQAELQADFTHFIGGRLGYRFRHRTIADEEVQTATRTFLPTFAAAPCVAPCTNTVTTAGDEGELDTFDYTEHTGILGLWIRPLQQMHFNFDTELTSSGSLETRVSPRHQQQYRAEFSYSPVPWATVGASMNLVERRNHNVDTDYDGHVRNFGLDFTFAPNDRIGVDAAYNFTDFQQNANICYIGQNTGVASLPCPTFTGLFTTLGNFTNTDDFVHLAVRVKPVKRLSLALGYGITASDGTVLRLNSLQPFGVLNSRWQTPMAQIGIGLTSSLFFNAGWNYYGYGEDDVIGPTAGRNFHSNIATLSLKYAF
jgi:hypothetical protein